MNKKEALEKDLLTNGKTKTWDQYAKQYNLTVDQAKGVYKRLKVDKEYFSSIVKPKLENEIGKVLLMPNEVTIDNDFALLMKKALVEAEELEHLQEINHTAITNNYIADLENKIVEYTEDAKKGIATKTVETIEEVQSLDDLIRICKIDTEVWDIARYSQKYAAGKYTVEAFMSRKESIITNVDSNLRQSLIDEIREYHENKRLDNQLINLGEDLSFKSLRETKDRDQLLELAVFDLHLGKFSWNQETGDDYDIPTALVRYKNCIQTLLGRVDLSRIDRILLPIGNDMLNIDNKQKTTTGGTPQDTDTRYAKIFKTAVKLVADTVRELSVIAPVDVVVVPGNHDQTSMFTIGEVLDAMFMLDENITIYNDPKLRKYYRYGENMIMFTHGSDEKHADLGLIAATEMPKMWAETKYREVHLGHLHKSKSVKYTNVDEYQGFKIRILNSLSGTDAWHYSKGYMALKGAEAFIWDYNKGLITNHFYNL